MARRLLHHDPPRGVVGAVVWGMTISRLSGKQGLARWVMVVLVVSLTSCAVDIGQQSELELATGEWRMGRFA